MTNGDAKLYTLHLTHISLLTEKQLRDIIQALPFVGVLLPLGLKLILLYNIIVQML